MSVWISPRRRGTLVLYAMLAACATLILVLAVALAAEARRLVRLFRAQQEWAELMDLFPSSVFFDSCQFHDCKVAGECVIRIVGMFLSFS